MRVCGRRVAPRCAGRRAWQYPQRARSGRAESQPSTGGSRTASPPAGDPARRWRARHGRLPTGSPRRGRAPGRLPTRAPSTRGFSLDVGYYTAMPELTHAQTRSPKWALILGASSGFGEGAARALAQAGYDIAGVHLDRKAGLEHVAQIRRDIERLGRKDRKSVV